VLLNQERVTYEAFGLGHDSRASRVDPWVWLRYLTLVARGRHPAPPPEDRLQLGGDVLVRRDGRTGWIYRSRGPEDRPSLNAVARARRGS
jgi:hypothetical protein